MSTSIWGQGLPEYVHKPVVYYMTTHGLGLIKIGTTNCLGRRFKAAEKTYNGVDEFILLAWEYGSTTLESSRQREFGDIRFTRDWFLYRDPLVSHIQKLDSEEMPEWVVPCVPM